MTGSAIRLAAAHEELRAARLNERLTVAELAHRVREGLIHRPDLAAIIAEVEAMRAEGWFLTVGVVT